MYRVFVFAFLTACLAVLPATIGLIPPALAQAPAQPSQPQVEEPRPVLSVPPAYKYDSRGRRDPFVNPIPKPPAPPKAISINRPPGLKGVLVEEVSLLGVVTSREASMTRVIIQAPGNKTYFAARGNALFDAVVKEIRPDAVVFTLRPLGNTPQQQPANRELVRRVRPAPGDNQ